jgi:hypothetical protein
MSWACRAPNMPRWHTCGDRLDVLKRRDGKIVGKIEKSNGYWRVTLPAGVGDMFKDQFAARDAAQFYVRPAAQAR